MLLQNFKNVSNVPKSFKSTFGPTIYEVESRHGVTYWIREKGKPDGKLRIAHHNQLRRLESKADKVQDKINLRDKVMKPARLGFPLENEDEM